MSRRHPKHYANSGLIGHSSPESDSDEDMEDITSSLSDSANEVSLREVEASTSRRSTSEESDQISLSVGDDGKAVSRLTQSEKALERERARLKAADDFESLLGLLEALAVDEKSIGKGLDKIKEILEKAHEQIEELKRAAKRNIDSINLVYSIAASYIGLLNSVKKTARDLKDSNQKILALLDKLKDEVFNDTRPPSTKVDIIRKAMKAIHEIKRALVANLKDHQTKSATIRAETMQALMGIEDEHDALSTKIKRHLGFGTGTAAAAALGAQGAATGVLAAKGILMVTAPIAAGVAVPVLAPVVIGGVVLAGLIAVSVYFIMKLIKRKDNETLHLHYQLMSTLQCIDDETVNLGKLIDDAISALAKSNEDNLEFQLAVRNINFDLIREHIETYEGYLDEQDRALDTILCLMVPKFDPSAEAGLLPEIRDSYEAVLNRLDDDPSPLQRSSSLTAARLDRLQKIEEDTLREVASALKAPSTDERRTSKVASILTPCFPILSQEIRKSFEAFGWEGTEFHETLSYEKAGKLAGILKAWLDGDRHSGSTVTSSAPTNQLERSYLGRPFTHRRELAWDRTNQAHSMSNAPSSSASFDLRPPYSVRPQKKYHKD